MIDDIDGLTETVDGKKYLKIISGGDIKIKKLEITEYNPLTTCFFSIILHFVNKIIKVEPFFSNIAQR